MKFIGLTGSIGSGKSSIGEYFINNYGYEIIQADDLARHVTEPKREAWNKLKEIFEPKYFDKNGNINRLIFAKYVLSDKKIISIVNKIVHKFVFQELIFKLDSIFTKNKNLTVIYEVPLLFETKIESIFQKTILVYCHDKVINKRLIKNRRITQEMIDLFRKNQLSSDYKLKLSDYIVENNGNFQNLEKKIKILSEEINKNLSNISYKDTIRPRLVEFYKEHYDYII